MMSVELKINGEEIVTCHVIRISPVDRFPEQEEVCTYNFFAEGDFIDTIEFPYGDGVKLAVEMLETYDEVM